MDDTPVQPYLLVAVYRDPAGATTTTLVHCEGDFESVLGFQLRNNEATTVLAPIPTGDVVVSANPRFAIRVLHDFVLLCAAQYATVHVMDKRSL